MRFLLVAITAVLCACASTAISTVETPLYKYRADMEITLGTSTYTGMAVTVLQGPIDIALNSAANLDLLRITTCHRDFTQQNVDSGWFGGSGKAYTYHYDPQTEEKDGVCPIYIEAYSKDSVTDWGFVVFRNGEDYPATMECNGTTWHFSGISVCQVKAGLAQVIRFADPVKFAAEPTCHLTANSPTEYVVKGDLGFCRAVFSPDGKRKHRLILLGYDKVLTR